MNKIDFIREKAKNLVNAANSEVLNDGSDFLDQTTSNTYTCIAQMLLDLVNNDVNPPNLVQEVMLLGIVRSLFHLDKEGALAITIKHNDPSHSKARKNCQQILNEIISDFEKQDSLADSGDSNA